MESNEFNLTELELEHIWQTLDGQYDQDAIVLVHGSVLLSPRLIQLGILPGPETINLFDPDFHISTVHVAVSMRISGVDQFGLLYYSVLSRWGIEGWSDINLILHTMQQLQPSTPRASLWVTRIVKLQESSDEVFAQQGIFKDNEFEDAVFCSEIVEKAFSQQLMIAPKEEQKKIALKMSVQNFLQVLQNLMQKKRREEDDITDLTDDDIAE